MGIAGAVMTLKDKGKIGGMLMIVGAVAPAMFVPKSLVFTFILLLGGIVSLMAKPKPAAWQ